MFSCIRVVVFTSAVVVTATAFSSESITNIDVAAPEDAPVVWAMVDKLKQLAAAANIPISSGTAPLEGDVPTSDFLLLPLRSMATQVPELQVLELPFFYDGIDGVRCVLDGDLSIALRQAAKDRSWEILAFLDEGMHVISGPRRYDRTRNFLGMEFILTRQDPMAEQLLGKLYANRRHIAPQDREEVMRECIVASRETTLPEMKREKLYLVHQNLALTWHRYEGWLIVMPAKHWQDMDEQRRAEWQHLFNELTRWQRAQVTQQDAAILEEFRKDHLLIYDVDDTKQEAFRRSLPAPVDMLPSELDATTRASLVELASAGAAVVTGTAASPVENNNSTSPAAQNR